MDIVADLNELVTFLETADLDDDHTLRVVTDLSKVNTPCAFVALESIDHYLSGGEVTWRIYLVAPYTDQTRVVAQLEKLLNAVLAIGIAPSQLTEYVGLPVPEQSQPLPALLIRITRTV